MPRRNITCIQGFNRVQHKPDCAISQGTLLKVLADKSVLTYEPRCEKTCLLGFRPDPTQTRLYNHRIWLEA